MRNRWVATLAANQRWPDASQASGGPGGLGRFNWVKVQNAGTNPVDVLAQPSWNAIDYTRIYCTVGAGKVRVFNVAGPKPAANDQWWDQLFLYSALGTTVVLEVADHPIVDQSQVM